MKRPLALAAALLGLAFLTSAVLPVRAGDAPKKSAAELEKEKAMSHPYPNDLGPETLDEATLKSYPANVQEGYKTMLGTGKEKRCQACHTAARPLNSRFVELSGKDAAVTALKKSNPELFKDPAIWQIEGAVWNRYVKRMMAKPGCNINSAEGKKIWEFVVYDSEHRKIGPNAAKWKAHRTKLLEEFKVKFPERYKELAAAKDL